MCAGLLPPAAMYLAQGGQHPGAPKPTPTLPSTFQSPSHNILGRTFHRPTADGAAFLPEALIIHPRFVAGYTILDLVGNHQCLSRRPIIVVALPQIWYTPGAGATPI